MNVTIYLADDLADLDFWSLPDLLHGFGAGADSLDDFDGVFHDFLSMGELVEPSIAHIVL